MVQGVAIGSVEDGQARDNREACFAPRVILLQQQAYFLEGEMLIFASARVQQYIRLGQMYILLA
jgi:hypothetical protein